MSSSSILMTVMISCCKPFIGQLIDGDRPTITNGTLFFLRKSGESARKMAFLAESNMGNVIFPTLRLDFMAPFNVSFKPMKPHIAHLMSMKALLLTSIRADALTNSILVKLPPQTSRIVPSKWLMIDDHTETGRK